MTKIHVNHSTLEAAEGQIKKFASDINAKLDTLRQGLAKMEWQGTDQQAYQAYQDQWNTSAANLNDILNQIGAMVGVAHQNYLGTEQANAKMFQ
jgi:early secretory antigenic target protein ESAT-6